MRDDTVEGLLLAGIAFPGYVGGKATGQNAAIRSQRTRRKMAEKARRATARKFCHATGIAVPAALDGRSYREEDFDAVAALIEEDPRLRRLVDQFCEIDEQWMLY